MPKEIAYSVSATATGGGRDGHAKTDDGALDITLAHPKALGGSGDGHNPEQLFATGYAACFLGAMHAAAGKMNTKLPDDASVKAIVGIGPREDNGFGLDVKLEVSLPGMDRDEAMKVIAEGDDICPYSNATKDNLAVKPKLV